MLVKSCAASAEQLGLRASRVAGLDAREQHPAAPGAERRVAAHQPLDDRQQLLQPALVAPQPEDLPREQAGAVARARLLAPPAGLARLVLRLREAAGGREPLDVPRHREVQVQRLPYSAASAPSRSCAARAPAASPASARSWMRQLSARASGSIGAGGQRHPALAHREPLRRVGLRQQRRVAAGQGADEGVVVAHAQRHVERVAVERGGGFRVGRVVRLGEPCQQLHAAADRRPAAGRPAPPGAARRSAGSLCSASYQRPPRPSAAVAEPLRVAVPAGERGHVEEGRLRGAVIADLPLAVPERVEHAEAVGEPLAAEQGERLAQARLVRAASS